MTEQGVRMTTDSWVADLAADRALLEQTGTAERVADILRQHLIDGRLLPGSRLSEERIGSALAVSRNTLREAFRLLVHERLLIHELHRGVFVRVLTSGDVTDLYRMRRMLETSAIQHAGVAPQEKIAAVTSAVEEGEQAAGREDWHMVGTANMHFHQAIAALADSPRVDETMRQLLAELRLAFHAMPRTREFHEPYLQLNRELADLMAAGDHEQAERRLESYFDTACEQLTGAFEQ